MSDRREQKSATLRVKLKYPDVETFLVKYGPNISRGGVFISTKTPKAVGTQVRFDFVLVHEGAETSVLRGEGAVHFVREPDTMAPTRPSGMGIKFTRLLDDGQALVDRALRLRAGNRETTREPEREATGPLPENIREVTGEVELVTGPVPKLDSPPDVPPPDREPMQTDELESLLLESGLTPARVQATLERRRDLDGADDALSALLDKKPATVPSAAEAMTALDELLKRSR